MKTIHKMFNWLAVFVGAFFMLGGLAGFEASISTLTMICGLFIFTNALEHL